MDFRIVPSANFSVMHMKKNGIYMSLYCLYKCFSLNRKCSSQFAKLISIHKSVSVNTKKKVALILVLKIYYYFIVAVYDNRE